jgi:hypothetical protein
MSRRVYTGEADLDYDLTGDETPAEQADKHQRVADIIAARHAFDAAERLRPPDARTVREPEPTGTDIPGATSSQASGPHRESDDSVGVGLVREHPDLKRPGCSPRGPLERPAAFARGPHSLRPKHVGHVYEIIRTVAPCITVGLLLYSIFFR